MVDDLKELLFTSMQSIVSLNKLVTELTEDVSRLTLSLAHLRDETTTSRTKLEKSIADVTSNVDALKDSDTCEQLKSCSVKEEEEEEDEEEDTNSPLDGAWSCWTDWSACSADCGGGNQTRTRTCTNPAPAHGGAQCEGNSSETQNCNSHTCPMDSGWTNWTDWTECEGSTTCGSQGFQTRNRSCTNPAPANGGTGSDCIGNHQEFQRCIVSTSCSVTVLKFVESSNYAYIGGRPDMAPLQEELSVCAWIKKLRSGNDAIWFDYNMRGNNDAMCISDTEYHNTMVNHRRHGYNNRVTVTWATWHHHCSTWRRSTGTWRVYHDGVMLGERTKPGGTLNLGGYLAIGNDAPPNARYQFGGEMTKLNVFSKELTAAEVRAMKDAGIFSSIERNHEEDRYFKWEDILTWERGGTIRERIMTTAD